MDTLKYTLSGKWSFGDQPSRWIELMTSESFSEVKEQFNREKEKQTWGNKMWGLTIHDDEGKLYCEAEI